MGNLYTKIKIFHFKDKIDSLPSGIAKIMAPIHIRIKPTNICNHNCWYCSYMADKLQIGKDMVKRDYIPKDKMIEIIDDMLEMDVKSVSFSGGGEPFCYPYLLEAVKKISGSSIKFSSLTNGSRLQGELAEIFAHNGTWLRISIDGWDPDSYASYRGISKDEFSKVMNNIKNFKKLGGKCYLGISLVVDKKNYLHIYDFIKRIKDLGVDSIKVSPCVVSDIGMENNRYHQSIFNKVKEQMGKAIEKLANEKFEIFDAYHELGGEFKKEYGWCPYLQINPVIGADLNIYPCHDKAYNLKEGRIGSIKDCRFKEFWFLNKSNFFKINPSINCCHRCVANEKNKLILEYLNADKEHLAFV